MAGEKTMTEITHLYLTVCVFVFIVVSVSRKPGISEFTGNIINLGINTIRGGKRKSRQEGRRGGWEGESRDCSKNQTGITRLKVRRARPA